MASKDIDSDAASRLQIIRLIREADMPAENEPEDSGPSADDPDRDESSSPQARKKRVDDEDDSEVIVTLREAKYWVYTVLGQQACPFPPVRRQSGFHPYAQEPDYSALPLSASTLESLITGLCRAWIPSFLTPTWIVANGDWPR